MNKLFFFIILTGLPFFIQLQGNKTSLPKQASGVECSSDFNEVAAPITEKIMPLVERYRSGQTTVRPVIALAGCSGVGKSYFSKLLLAHLTEMKVNAKILYFDDFINPEPFEGAIREINPDFDYLNAHQFLCKLMEGEELIEKPIWNESGSPPKKVKEDFDLKEVELLIFEGEFALCDEKTYDLVRFSNLRVLIDAEDQDIVKWAWERDRHSTRDSFTAFASRKMGRLSRYRMVLDPLRQYVDFLVESDHDHKYAVKSFIK